MDMKTNQNSLITSINSSDCKEVLHNTLFSNELERLKMSIYEMSYAILDQNWHMSNLFVPFSRIYFVCKGSADIFCNGKQTTITPGNAYILPADSNYSFKCDSYLEKFYFHFNIYCQGNFDIFSSVKDIITLENRNEEIKILLDNWDTDDLLPVLQIKSILYKTVCDGLISSNISLDKINPYSDVVKHTFDYINNNLSANIKLDDIASELSFSKSYISKCFKNETGLSVKNYLANKLMIETAISLKHTNMTIKEISDLYGFYDQFYFSKLFTSYYGMPPKKYRQNEVI